MNNFIMLLGKVSSIDVELNTFTIVVSRVHKDENVTDVFVCKPWKGMYSYISSYINLDDFILVKGKLLIEEGKYIVKVEDYSLIQRLNKKISA